MAETELKFKVGEIPLNSGESKKIYQAYLDLSKTEVRQLLLKVMPGLTFDEMAEARIRSIEEEMDGEEVQCYLTLKGEGSKTREEKEAKITLADFQRLKAEASHELEKIRTEHEIAPGITAEYDKYLGKLSGLLIMEVEYNPERVEENQIREAVMATNPEAEEVTESGSYKNKELAKLKSLADLEPEQISDENRREFAEGIIKIAITGGPCGGKSEVLKHLQARYGEALTIMPEVATQLLEVPLEEGGVGIPGRDVEWTPEWQDEFQRRVIDKQLNDETYLTQVSDLKEHGIKIVICDRGIMDGAAYEPEGKETFLSKYRLDPELCYSLYDAVIHLNSLATDQPQLYDELKHTNPSRFEDAETARAIDERISQAYEGHRRLMRLTADGELAGKISRCQEIIDEMTGFRRVEIDETSPLNSEFLEVRAEGKPHRCV